MKRTLLFTLSLFLLIGKVNAQTADETAFLKKVASELIVPAELPHIFLEFSKDGHSLKLKNVFKEGELTCKYVNMDKGFAVYRITGASFSVEKEEEAYIVLKTLSNKQMGLSMGNSPAQAQKFFIATLGKYM